MTQPATPRPCVIGIDLGTTAIKVAAFVGDEMIHLASQPANLRRSSDGAAELDPREQLAAVHTALAQAIAGVRAAGYTVARVGISAAMHSLLAVDADGAPLTAAMTWADLRAEPDAEALWASPQGPAIYERTGAPIHAMTPLAKLLWLRRARPDIWRQAARFVGLKEWIWRQWFGEWAIDASLASATGLYNLRQRQWDADALALTGVSPERLSRIVPTTYTRTDILPAPLQAAGLAPGCAINIGASDGALANLAVHALDGRRLVLTIGTSLAVRVGASSVALDPATRDFCYVVTEERGLYVRGAPSNSGGALLEWVYQRGAAAFAADASGGAQVAPPTDSDVSFDAAMAAAGEAGSDGLYCLPYINGERAPLWTSRTSGAVVGLRSDHTAINVLRAAAEGIIFNARWIAEPLLAATPPPEAVIASGGALQSAWMRQLVADIFGLPVYEVSTLEASACGAATLADLAVDARSWASVSQPLAPASIAQPDMTRQTDYARRYGVFQRLARSLATGY